MRSGPTYAMQVSSMHLSTMPRGQISRLSSSNLSLSLRLNGWALQFPPGQYSHYLLCIPSTPTFTLNVPPRQTRAISALLPPSLHVKTLIAMEFAGFTLGVAGVTGTFQACLKCYGDILSLRVRDEDVQANYLALQIEQHRFSNLQGALDRDPSFISNGSRLWDDILSWMQKDIIRLSELLARHASAAPTDAPASRGSKIKRLAHGATWVADDKARLRDLVGRIRHWNEALADLLPEVKRQRVSFETVANSIAHHSPRELEYIERVTEHHYPLICQGAALRGMTLRSRGSLRTSGTKSLMKAPQWKRPADGFEWRPCGIKTTRPDLAEAAELERAFATYKNHDDNIETPVMVEWRDDFRSEESFRQFEYRLDYLVTILRKMARSTGSDDKNHLLPCLGWVTTSPRFDRIGLVFDVTPWQNTPSPSPPVGGPPHIASLHQLITRSRHDKAATPPSLGNRFALAYSIALALSNLCSLGWVHKEFRSQNILFTMPDDKLTRPFLAGLTYARPSGDSSHDLSLLNPDPACDLYRPSMQAMVRHQQRQQTAAASAGDSNAIPPTVAIDTRYRTHDADSDSDHESSSDHHGNGSLAVHPTWTPAMDVYGLGIVLLEIGLWRTVQELQGRATKAAFLERGLGPLVGSLAYRMGDLYMGVVKRCLVLGDWVDDEDRLRAFWAEALESLAACRA
ncbi:hypothetical protein QBC39DRAFT_337821 [Podospora conica]|nr:hypothetical protein QBC39DRAFT_337821 [Schizothecium conicum]